MAAAKSVLVSGAAGGIGRALCETFRASGYYVVATDRRSGDVSCDDFIPLDLREFVTKRRMRMEFARRVRNALAGKPLCVLVNNAAVQILGRVEELTAVEFNSSLAVNLTAPWLLVKTFLKDLKRSRGAVINIGSIHSTLTKPGFVAYATSKTGLLGLTRSLAVDLGPYGIRVNLIRPAATRTAMLAEGFRGKKNPLRRLAACHPLGRIGEPREIAELALFVASEQAGFLTGAALDIDGGISARLHDPD